MTQNDFILQYVAAKIAANSVKFNMLFSKDVLERMTKEQIKEAGWLWEALPDNLKLETNKS